ncbi:MAG: Pyruvate/2-oxoglutarate dehydrogenase complex, dihydrolipoamide acyltransferase [Myxococcales bacterium]|nr:Pyruvate/2-oxoglutarate dehydrogenase complex, dihydrolipoamide acyltransferase [Myxococcales bacterium]
MPLFSRPDGTLVPGLSPVRYIMPYLMKGRNESVVLHEARFDLSRTHDWLARYNETHERKGTLFHLLLFAVARTLHERPGLNRFISGGRIYQRNGVQLAFAAKAAFNDDAPIVTIKLEFPKEMTFDAVVERVGGSVKGARGPQTKVSTVDKELALAMKLPGFLLSALMSFLRWLDRVNLMPGGMIAGDPMYASAFLANLGSLGIDDTFHHLFEYGTVSLFGAVGRAEKVVVVGEDGKPAVRDGLKLCWTFDERINDGFYCASSLKGVQAVVEDPARFIT